MPASRQYSSNPTSTSVRSSRTAVFPPHIAPSRQAKSAKPVFGFALSKRSRLPPAGRRGGLRAPKPRLRVSLRKLSRSRIPGRDDDPPVRFLALAVRLHIRVASQRQVYDPPLHRVHRLQRHLGRAHV